MTYLLVRHKVTDFPHWKRVFDSHPAVQEKGGLRIDNVPRNVDDPNEVVLLYKVTDLEKAPGFVNWPEVPEVKEQSGVLDRPNICFLS